MSLLILRSFVEVYRSKSISAAARNLGVTQPAVSGHISTLEQQVGRELFRREPRGVAPTAYAEDLAAQIGDSLDRAEEVLAKARARSSNLSGVVHLAGPAELMAERVAPSLRPLQASGLDMRVHLGGRTTIYRKLIAGDVDLAFTASTPDVPQLAYQFVGSERLIAVAAPDMARRVLQSPDLETALSSEPLLAYDTDRPLVREWMRHNQMATEGPVPAITAPDLRMLRALLEAGMGWSVIPDYICSEALSAKKLVRLPGPVSEPTNPFHLVWSKSALRHPRVARARELLLESINSEP